MQRDWTVGQCRWSPRSNTWREEEDGEPEMESAVSGEQEFSAESTSAEGDSSEESSIVYEPPAIEEASEDESTAIGESSEDLISQGSAVFESASDRRQALVAGLREARLRAYTQRTGQDCPNESLEGSGLADREFRCSREHLLSEVRDLRTKAAICRASLTATQAPIEEMFTVTICTMNGSCHQIDNLNSRTQVGELCEIVATRLAIPNFAVRLIFGDEVLHMSQPGVTLGIVGVSEGSQLMLAINWGWAKPDLRTLVELEKQWRGESNVSAP